MKKCQSRKSAISTASVSSIFTIGRSNCSRTVRLHSAIGYVTPQAMLEGRQQAIFDERDRKLAEARERRAQARAEAREKAASNSPPPPNANYTNRDVAEGRVLLGSNSSAAPLPLTNVGSALSEITSISAATASTP